MRSISIIILALTFLMGVLSEAVAQPPEGPPAENPPSPPSFRTEWVNYSPPERAFALLRVGDDLATSGILTLKVSGNALTLYTTVQVYRPSSAEAIGAAPYDVFILGSADVARQGVVYISLDEDPIPGEILMVFLSPYQVGDTRAELTLPSGDTVRFDYHYDGTSSSHNFMSLQRRGFNPSRLGLVTTATKAGGTRERTGSSVGARPDPPENPPGPPPPFAKPVAVQRMGWGEMKNR